MRTIVLVGTTHGIQRGANAPELFRATLLELCISYQVRGIAEEIERNARTVAAELAFALKLDHLYADPDANERAEHGIVSDCRKDLIQEYAGRYPNIRWWPKEENEETLPAEVYAQYVERTAKADRMRERLWLTKIVEFDIWPLLFVCGADHFQPFSNLLDRCGFDLIKSHPDWPESVAAAALSKANEKPC
jgi:hypothetical protein